jgi:hypothetical protein
MSDPPLPEYTAGATVRVNARFVNAAGALADPTAVTAGAQYGPVNIVPLQSLTVIRDGTGLYHVEVPTASWLGPGQQVITVTFTGTGAIQAVFSDAFVVNPNPSSAADVLGP